MFQTSTVVETQAAISVRGLRREVSDSVGTLVILDGIDFDIEAGQTVAIVGASGSGKSTLLGILAGLDSPTAGSVRYAGRDILADDEDGRARWRAANLGFVFQSFQLLPHLTALENVMLPLELAGAPDARARGRAALEAVGLGARLTHRPATLSGGEQQRVALARAFVAEPRVLLADEPTGSLDAQTGEQIVQLMFDLVARHGTTVVLVTHDRALAGRCGRVLTMQAGRLSEG
ncbi:ABC transporter ATP-binding protein [Derxia lacustris]|uniref:ABC transporter ATP-binding protein n=1 Tax=Derxia lacustris TaxID=764842 RepID=UPI000A16F952|nr:ABC transporter ATP-binding protein [Derxia lacustris]